MVLKSTRMASTWSGMEKQQGFFPRLFHKSFPTLTSKFPLSPYANIYSLHIPGQLFQGTFWVTGMVLLKKQRLLDKGEQLEGFSWISHYRELMEIFLSVHQGKENKHNHGTTKDREGGFKANISITATESSTVEDGCSQDTWGMWMHIMNCCPSTLQVKPNWVNESHILHRDSKAMSLFSYVCIWS